MAHGNEWTLWIGEKKLAQRFYVGLLGLFQVLTCVFQQFAHQGLLAASEWFLGGVVVWHNDV